MNKTQFIGRPSATMSVRPISLPVRGGRFCLSRGPKPYMIERQALRLFTQSPYGNSV